MGNMSDITLAIRVSPGELSKLIQRPLTTFEKIDIVYSDIKNSNIEVQQRIFTIRIYILYM